MKKRRSVISRVAFIVVLSASWAIGRQFTKSALTTDPEVFFAPYFILWFMTNLLLLCYPAFLLYNRLANGQRFGESHAESQCVFSRTSFVPVTARVAPFLLLWIAANYTHGLSLRDISASAALAIRSSDVAIVYVLGLLLLGDRFSTIKFLAVLLAICGVVMTALDREFAGSSLGIGLVIASSLFSAVYKVLFKWVIGDATLGQVSFFMTLLGTMNLMLNTPVAALMLNMGADRMHLLTTPWIHVISSSLLALVFNFLIAFGIALLDPLTISVGMLCGLPMSASVDILLRSMSPSAMFLVGSAIITLSFVLITMPIRSATPRRDAEGGENAIKDRNGEAAIRLTTTATNAGEEEEGAK